MKFINIIRSEYFYKYFRNEIKKNFTFVQPQKKKNIYMNFSIQNIATN